MDLNDTVPTALPPTEVVPEAPVTADPNAVVGEIAPSAPEVPTNVAPKFHQPTAEELAVFAPPPPIAVPPVVPEPTTVPSLGMYPPINPGGVIMGDRTAASGLMMGHVVEPPKIIVDAPPPPPREVDFDALPEKTKAELHAGWIAQHGSLDGFRFGGNNTPPLPPVRVATEEPKPPVEEDVDFSKLPMKTQMELKAGRERLARRTADYRDVLAKVAASDAAKHEAGGKPLPSNMDYSPRG